MQSQHDLERQAAEVIQSWLQGAPPDARSALSQNPAFAGDKGVVLDLAFAEYLIREARGEKVDVEAFVRQFPDYHASLGRMLAQQSIHAGEGASQAGLGDRTVNVPITPLHDSASSGSGSGHTESAGPNGKGWPEAGARVGDFNLLRQLGKGAFGRVFLALEEPTSRHVVVKLTKQKCDEARVLGRVGHRNVVSVLSAPHDAMTGYYLIVMPYLGSATFEDLLEFAHPMKTGSQTPRRANVILQAARRNRQADDPAPKEVRPEPFLERASFLDGVVWLGAHMADALAAVHRCGFVHHDLKPSNVLLGLDGQPQLLDFNLASDAQHTKSRLGGTLPYMPPEHLVAVRHPDQSASTMDARGDIYSLGVMLYELLAGEHPFGRFPKSRSVRGVADEMLARQRKGVRPLREINPDVPARLARLVEQCLAFSASDRPSTAVHVAAELRRCYSTRKRVLEFTATRPGRLVATAAGVGLVSAATWFLTGGGPRTQAVEINHRDNGLSALKAGKYVDAIPSLAKAAHETPHDPELWYALGRARLAVGELRTSLGDLERAVEMRPSHGPSQATLAWLQVYFAHFEAGDAAIDRAQKAGSDSAALQTLRAFSQVRQSDPKKAMAAIDAALQLDPNFKPAIACRASLGFSAAVSARRPVPPEVLRDVELALGDNPTHPMASYWGAQIYAWAAHEPVAPKAPWPANRAALKERCRELLRMSVELGLPAAFWGHDTAFRFLFGNPEDFAKDWARPAKEFTPGPDWRMGNPLKDFPG